MQQHQGTLSRLQVTTRLLGLPRTMGAYEVLERLTAKVSAAVGNPSDLITHLKYVWGLSDRASSAHILVEAKKAIEALGPTPQEKTLKEQLSWNCKDVYERALREAQEQRAVQVLDSRRSVPIASNSIDVTGLEGRNFVERLLSYLKHQPGGDKLSWRELNARAHELAKTNLIYDDETPGHERPSTLSARALAAKSTPAAQKRTISLRGCHGRNRVERLQWWIRCNEPGGEKLSWGALNERSSALIRDPNVLIDDDPRAA